VFYAIRSHHDHLQIGVLVGHATLACDDLSQPL
jgi:hypothetical protein